MKIKSIYLASLATISISLTACDGIDGTFGNDTPPSGALPSAEFNPNDLSDEPYAEDAIKVVVTTDHNYAPFYSLELMPDGHYLLSTNPPANTYYAPVTVDKKGNNYFLRKKQNDEVAGTRSLPDESGTTTFDDGSQYGLFEKIGSKQYALSNGMIFNLLNATSGHHGILYTNVDGTTSEVYVNISSPETTEATTSLCRAWSFDSQEAWAYFNGTYAAHGKQVQVDGVVDTSFNAIGGDLLGIEQSDLLPNDNEMCYKVIFTAYHTYLCFYLDGTWEKAQWEWTDETQGTLHYQDILSNSYYDASWDGYVTIRFAGNQMRVYEDYTEEEDDFSVRTVIVSTLTAINQ